MTFLPTTSSFKVNVGKGKRYERICESLNDESTLCYLSFVAYFASDFESFLTKFQSMKPLIHILYEEMETLLWNVMAKFVKSKYLTNKNNGEKRALAGNELLLGQTADTNVVKNLKNIDTGTKAKGLFLASALDIDENEKKFRSDCLQAYRKTTNYLKNMIPFKFFMRIQHLLIRKTEMLMAPW